MAIRYPNLAAEIARESIAYESIYSVVSDATGKKVDTVSKWMNNRAGEMPVTAAFAIRDEFFPSMTVDYLFGKKAES